MKLHEMQRALAQLAKDARAVVSAAETAGRPMNDEERTKYNEHLTKGEALQSQIAERQRLDALEGFCNSAEGRQGDPLPHQEARHQGKYSLLRAVRQCAGLQKVDGLEGETSKELETRRGKAVRGNGFILPLDLAIDLRSAAIGRTHFGSAEQRAGVMNTTTGVGGIATILDTTYIDLLRNRMVTRQAGARVLNDMHGNFAIPRQNQAGTAQWVAEGSSPAASNQTVDQVPFTPRTVGAYTDITRRLAEQINTDAEMFVRDDLANVVARALDLAGLNGTGASNQPLGILQNSSIAVTALGTNGAAPTWAGIVGMETSVATANADMGALSYVTNAKVRGTLKQTTKVASSTFPIYMWDGGSNPVNGYPAFVSNQIPSNLAKGTGTSLSAMIYGNWNDLIYALWSGMDVIVDPYTLSSSGGLRLVTLQDADVNVRHPESFNNCVDIITL